MNIIAAQTIECIQYLNGANGDGARERNGHGPDKFDSPKIRSLATYRTLTSRQVDYALKIMQKYRKQLESAGLQLPTSDGKVTEDEFSGLYDTVESSEAPIIESNPEPPMQGEIVLSDEQKALFEAMENTRDHIYVTGYAGTGKSVLLEHFRNNTEKKCIVVAPTGIAALNVHGQTMHSAFQLPFGFHNKGTLRPNSRICTVLKRIDTVIIDEISMVRADYMDAVDERLREATQKNKPFGGVQVIMFGDLYQLPPVVKKEMKPYFDYTYGGGVHFFHADVWSRVEFKIYELTQIFRQKDPVFKDLLNAVRDGSVTDDQIATLNERLKVPVPKEGAVTLAPTNALVNDINKRRLSALPEKEYKYKADIVGEIKDPPTEETIYLKKSAQVVLLKNDKDGRWVNGTVAIVDEIDEKHITVKIDEIVYDLEQITWEEIQYTWDPLENRIKEEVVGTFTQFPVRLAFAMTIHKSQGQTYKEVICDLTTDVFAAGQLYVLLSRCTSLEGLFLRVPIRRAHVMVDAKVAAFMAQKKAIIVEAERIIVEEEPQVVESAVSQQELFIAEEQPAPQQQEEVKPAKKVGRHVVENPVRNTKPASFAADEEIIAFLAYLKGKDIDKSKYIRRVLKAQPEYQQWMKTQLDSFENTNQFINGLLAQKEGTL